MNAVSVVLCLGICMSAMAVQAQVVPTTPTHFTKRDMGAGFSAGGVSISNSGTGSATAGVAPAKPETTVTTTTYIVLSGPRQWTSSDGRPLLAKLIAFEQGTAVTTKAEAASAASAQPNVSARPTVVKDGKARLLVNQKPFEVTITKLSQADQDFITTVKRAVEATP